MIQCLMHESSLTFAFILPSISSAKIVIKMIIFVHVLKSYQKVVGANDIIPKKKKKILMLVISLQENALLVTKV